MTLFLGIDPGVTGAVAALDAQGNVISLQNTPVIKVARGKGVRSEYSEPGMSQLLYGIVGSHVRRECAACGAYSRMDLASVLVTIENVHAMPKQGVASSFSFGVGYGIWRGIIAALGMSCERVEPQVWKRALGLPSKKGAAISRALRLYPRADIGHMHHGRMVYDDGRAEALLIARYALEHSQSKKSTRRA